MDPIALRCPSCASPISMGDLDRSREFLKCSHCGTALALASPKNEPAANPRARPEVPLPASIQVEREADGVVIRRRWFTPSVLVLVIFCVAWDSFLVFWYSMASSTDAPWIMTVFPIGHVAVGVGLTYSALATLFNSTRISVTRSGLTIRHGPVPWMGNVEIARSDIDQLYCRCIVRNQGDSRTQRYEVWLKERAGRGRKLLGAGLDLDQALAIEQQTERAMGIADRPVPGEVER